MAKRRSLMGDDDAGLVKTSRTGDDADLDITPMIDVTFLLLIFFMVTSTMQSTPDLDVPPAKHGVGADMQESLVVNVKKPDPTAAPIIEISGNQVSLDEVRSAVNKSVSEGKMNVIIMGDREIPHGFMIELEKAITEIEGVSFSIGIKDVR